MNYSRIRILLLFVVLIGFVAQPVYAVPDDFKENDTYWINQELDIFSDTNKYNSSDIEEYTNNTSLNNTSINSTSLNNTSISIKNNNTSLLVTKYVVNNNSELVFDLQDYKNNEYNIIYKDNKSKINFTYINNSINIQTKGKGKNIINRILNIL